DETFRVHYEAMQREMANSQSSIHHSWTAADAAVVWAWIDGRYDYPGESWKDFTARVHKARRTIERHSSGERVAVSTSATPIGIWAGLAMELNPRYIMRTAGVLHNASYTTFRLCNGEISLFSLNNIPHLKDAAMRTFR